MTAPPVEHTFEVLVGLLPSNKVVMQVAMDGKILSSIELDKNGALQISGQLAEMARKLDATQ